MLQHSRASTGKKEPTAINALANEHLRLSYQALCAKDPAFNASLKTNLDPQMARSTLYHKTLAVFYSTCTTMPFLLALSVAEVQ